VFVLHVGCDEDNDDDGHGSDDNGDGYFRESIENFHALYPRLIK
jgi:hypothetical protein